MLDPNSTIVHRSRCFLQLSFNVVPLPPCHYLEATSCTNKASWNLQLHVEAFRKGDLNINSRMDSGHDQAACLACAPQTMGAADNMICLTLPAVTFKPTKYHLKLQVLLIAYCKTAVVTLIPWPPHNPEVFAVATAHEL